MAFLRSPRIKLTPLRLPSVTTVTFPSSSFNSNKLFSSPRVLLSPLKFKPRRLITPTTPSAGSTFNNKYRGFSTISKCNGKRCGMCSIINCNSTITSSVNGQTFKIQIDNDIDWSYQDVIYVITWNARGCGAQYVGETGQSLKSRFRSHSYQIRNSRQKKHRNFLYNHFVKYNHSISDITITPVQSFPKLKNQSKAEAKKRRLQAELSWITKLQTAYPLGLNDQIYGQGNISSSSTNINVFSIRPNTKRKHRSHGKRRNKKLRKRARVHRTLTDLLIIARNGGRHELLHALSSIPAVQLKSILDDAQVAFLRNTDWFRLNIIVAFAQNKLYPVIKNIPPKRRFIKIPFINKGFDLLNISNIFRDHRVQTAIPQYFENVEPPLICYKYKKPIRNFVFNYNKVTSDPKILESCPASWDCATSEYLYKPAGHIVTGDFSIIKDKQLRGLLRKGPKYRIPSKVDFIKCREVLKEALDNYTKRWCKSEGVESHSLNDWKNLILDITDIRIDNFHKNPHLFENSTSKSERYFKSKLSSLHEKYVFVPADKAANNTIIIWKRYYISTLVSELSSTNRYIKSNESIPNILSEDNSEISSFSIPIS